jgi:23S rRNA (cytidine1920-2'-O)/16S rRNA (cytidine1409-2'-O)-methyltransferase
LKKRIDLLLVELGLAPTIEKAQAMTMAGLVLADDQPVVKAGTPISDTAVIRLKDPAQPFVSRGGLKIDGAARAFGLDVANLVAIDIGSSTGGFTHYLLLNGARHVYAVDVDVTQLDWQLRNDSRVTPVEVNARFLETGHFPELADLVTIDASFISLTMLLPRVPALLKSGGRCLALVKPQFEVERGKVGKGGIVRDSEDQKAAVEKILQCGRSLGLEVLGSTESPITGREGNREFFVLFRKP